MCFLKDFHTQNVPTNIFFKTYYQVIFAKKPRKLAGGGEGRLVTVLVSEIRRVEFLAFLDVFVTLRWLITVSSTFQDSDFDVLL